ncbi:MAG: ABC transporter ATP-binding protein [Clostridia bacterium]|nr:ABC transporter ATP-binding protein [Clostridia bacterium]
MSENVKRMSPNAAEEASFDGKKRRFAPAQGQMRGPRGAHIGPKPKLKDAKSTVKRLLKYLAGVKYELLFAMLALVCTTVTSLITPKISGNIINILHEGYFTQNPVHTLGMTFAVSTSTAYFLDRLRTRRGKKNGSADELIENGKQRALNIVLQGAVFTAVAGAVMSKGASVNPETVTLVEKPDYAQLLRTQLTYIAILFLISTLCSLTQQLLLVRISQHTVRTIRSDLFGKLQNLTLRYFDSTPHGELMSRLTNDVDNVSNMLSNTLTQILSSVITIFVCLYMMLSISWQLTLVSFITVPLSMFIMRFITKRTGKYFKAQQACLGELNGIVEETVSGARVVKVFCREKHVEAEFDEANEDLTHAGVKANIFSSVMGPMMNAVGNIAYALMSGIGGCLVVWGRVPNIGSIQSFLQYQRQFSNPFTQIANQITMIQSALAGAERVFEVMDKEPETADIENADAFDAPSGKVEFRDVSFGYNKDVPILKHLTFTAEPGQTIALVGPTGAGKTTVVNLLMRFYDIDSGELLLDGKDIKTLQRQSLRTHLGMVLQDVYLFAGTVRDNIIYGKLDATEEEIRRAIKMADCEEFIDRLPNGLDTELTESGSNISQGQRQLLSIARAILADPAVLILDEATSSVDTRTEMRIQQAMLTLMKGRTSFVIAHRLSTIRNADLILVLNQGEIIERGTHDELVAKGGFYAELLNSQYKSGVLEEDDT